MKIFGRYVFTQLPFGVTSHDNQGCLVYWHVKSWHHPQRELWATSLLLWYELICMNIIFVYIHISLFQKIYPLLLLSYIFLYSFYIPSPLKNIPKLNIDLNRSISHFPKIHPFLHAKKPMEKPTKQYPTHLTILLQLTQQNFMGFFFKSSFIFSVLPFLSVTFVELSTVWTRKMGQNMWGYQT